MKRSLQLGIALVAVVMCLAPHALRADPPDILGAYRFAPRRSTIVSRANPAFELNVYGTFDFIRAWDYRNDPPPVTLVHYADFDNVNAWAQNPLSLAPPLNLDAIFNLSGLIGEQLPTASIFDVYKFAGKNVEGDQVEFFVSVLGRWLYLRGETAVRNHPDAGWRMNAFARERPFADFDESGDVTVDDLAVWEDCFGTWMGMNDADGNDFQTGADFLYWQQQLGETPPDPAAFGAAIDAALAGAAGAVPEPSAAALAALALGAFARWRGRAPGSIR